MISDSTAVALAVGPAAVTAVAGYAGARLQSKTRIKELEQALTGKRRDERAAACAEYLEVDLALTSKLVSGNLTKEWYDEWEHDRHVAAIARLALLADDSVFNAANALHRAIGEDVMEPADKVGEAEGTPFGEAAAARWDGDVRQNILSLRRDMRNAMRADIA